jgi:hypothetical protein
MQKGTISRVKRQLVESKKMYANHTSDKLILPFAGKCMELENIMLSEVSKVQKE